MVSSFELNVGGNAFRSYWLSRSPELGDAGDDAATLYVEASKLSYPSGWEWVKGTWVISDN